MKKRRWRKAELKPDDILLKDARPTDIVILYVRRPWSLAGKPNIYFRFRVMGPSGVGKSTFISAAVGRNVTTTNQNLLSSVATAQHTIFPYPYDTSRRVVLVDLPGFADSYERDVEVLRRNAVWMAYSYSHEVKISGIIYLHDISDHRSIEASRRNFHVFQHAFGIEASHSIIYATTKWDNTESYWAENREQPLRETLREALYHGAEMARFMGTRQSAWDIIDSITSKKPLLDGLQIQNEMVESGKFLEETSAGKFLRSWLQDQASARRRMIDEMEAQGKTPLSGCGRVEDLEVEMSALLGQIHKLEIPVRKRIMALLHLR
ncbi:hypothetical protein BJ138DRAFT_1012351 [Hygrophoropsis aurantiaca]|uniref:Uncharacterized protein n=1 Tax=Hygrophoropsis aurantiaca TaxID=72124 RepID=A0ACB8A5K1_9AGAM|nr:hypothetical protein BJ138DRAFT_1012351 [Hygrophoropsis aurantiaca]